MSLNPRLRHRLIYAAAMAYALAAWIAVFLFTPPPHLWLWIMGLGLPLVMFRSLSPFAEASILVILWWICKALGFPEDGLLYLPLALSLLGWGVWHIGTTLSLVWAQIPAWLWLGTGFVEVYAHPNPATILLWLAGLVLWVVFCVQFMVPARGPLARLDVLLCSYSGNTAHCARQFIHGAESAGATVREHRFHYADEFSAEFAGDGLVLAFPVSGWKPPWPLVAYLLNSLPAGRGKPAFILYSSAGGPDNAGVLAWLLLTVKGYRVLGRHWAAYPMNVPTFRLGMARWWRWLDSLVPLRRDLEDIRNCGRDFTRGRRAGLPMILWPSPLALVGILLDNAWVNVGLYRNWVKRLECSACGLCVSHCPSHRLRLEDGRPRARGTCALCLGCVNLCPRRAMNLAAWTEYGQPYKPRWPELVVKSKTSYVTKADLKP